MFRLLGFDVHVRTGFLIFLGLIVFLYQDGFGLWLAAALAGFTLLHELGHAVAARRAGAEAAISLDFLAGYTSYRPRRPIGRRMRAVISAAGPASQIGASLLVLAAMGVNPLSLDSVRESDAAAAIWWAGPIIGVLNLIPVLPLDGGHLALTAIEGVAGKQAMRIMAIASIVVTAGGAVLLFVFVDGAFAIFVVFLLINQVQILQSLSKRTRQPAMRHAEAEMLAWQTGRPGILEPGQRLSPWWEAHRSLAAGNRERAAAVILDDLRSADTPRWMLPVGASPNQLRAVVETLPRELPANNAYSARVLAEILLTTGFARRGGEYAARAFESHRTSPLATIVARAAAAFGDTANALAWLGAAVDAASGEAPGYRNLLASAMGSEPEFAQLRGDPEFARLRAQLASMPGGA